MANKKVLINGVPLPLKEVVYGFFPFYVKHGAKLDLKLDGRKITLNFPPVDENNLDPDSVFFHSFDYIQDLTRLFHLRGNKSFEARIIIDKQKARDYFGLPPDFSCYEKFVPLESRLSPFKKKNKINIAFVAFGGGLGDTIVGKTALELLLSRLQCYFSEINFFLYPIKLNSLSLLSQIPNVSSIQLLPAPLSSLKKADFYFDFSMMTGHYNFNALPMIDYFLFHLGIDPSSIPPEKKRCSYRINEGVVKELEPVLSLLKKRHGPLLLYHFKATTPIRSIPPQLIPKHIRDIIDNTDFTVASVLPCRFNHPRFLDLSGLSKSFDHFAYIISQMDAIITVDTVTFHLADAFSIPTVVLFTSIPPELRIKYYPHQKGILIGGKNGKPLFYCHETNEKKLVSAFRKAWKKFSILEAVKLLKECVSD